MKLNNKGFGAIEIALIIVVIGILGFVGYRAYSVYTAEEASKDSLLSERDKEKSEPKQKKEVPKQERVKLGQFSFVKPDSWSELKSVTPSTDDLNKPKLAAYSFSVKPSDIDSGDSLNNGQIFLIKTSDVNTEVGSAQFQSYNETAKTWDSISKTSLANQNGIVADYFGDGVGGGYDLTINYYLVKGDYTVGVYVTESGKGYGPKDHYSFTGDKSSKSNQFQEQVVTLLKSVK